MYAEDSNGKLMTGINSNGEDATWMQMLRSYYQNPKIRLCPTAKKLRWDENGDPTGFDGRFAGWGPWPNSGGWWTKGDYGSYGINEWSYGVLPDGSTAWGGDPDANWGKLDVPGAGNVPLMLDCYWDGGCADTTNGPPPSPDDLGGYGLMARFCTDRHNTATNGLFYDLSARKLGIKELWTLKWNRKTNTKGPFTLAGGATRATWESAGAYWMAGYKAY